MGLETGTYISALNASNPVTGDNKTEGDDHLRLIKSTLLATFPSVTGAVTATHTALNSAASGTFAVSLKSTVGGVYSYGLSGDNNDGVFYGNSAGTQYIRNINNAWRVTGTIEGNGGGGNGLGKITVSTSAPSGGAAGDIWIQY